VKTYEIIYPSVNTSFYPKSITACIYEPDQLSPKTGAMLFTHGWGNNRFATRDHMIFACEAFDLICISVEFRQSGYDCDPVSGTGWDIPYDASFFQVFDVLNGLRAILDTRTGINRQRLFHYGGSQGGHIALLSSIFAPQTFALVYAACPVTFLDTPIQEWAGRHFTPCELSIRNVIEHAEMIRCPIFLEHGTTDETVPDFHTRRLVDRLQSLNKSVIVRYHEGGDHGLGPATSRLETFKQTAPDYVNSLVNSEQDDFLQGSSISIPCGQKTLLIDWSKPAVSMDLVRWV
jgi:acetyl esterase/lipase